MSVRVCVRAWNILALVFSYIFVSERINECACVHAWNVLELVFFYFFLFL